MCYFIKKFFFDFSGDIFKYLGIDYIKGFMKVWISVYFVNVIFRFCEVLKGIFFYVGYSL